MSTIKVNGVHRFIGGWKPPTEEHRRLAALRHMGEGLGIEPEQKGFQVADEMDLQWLRELIGPVLDQGQVGRCVWETMFQIVNAVRAKYNLPPLPFSTLWGYARTRQREGTPLSEDTGCVITDAISVLCQLGFATTATWGDDDAEQRFRDEPPVESDAEAARYRSYNAYSLIGQRWQMACHTLCFPVAVGIPVYESFETVGADGRVPLPEPGERILGGHAMPSFGHSKSFENLDGSRGAWKIVNSWGPGFGKNGWIFLPFSYPGMDDLNTVHAVYY